MASQKRWQDRGSVFLVQSKQQAGMRCEKSGQASLNQFYLKYKSGLSCAKLRLSWSNLLKLRQHQTFIFQYPVPQDFEICSEFLMVAEIFHFFLSLSSDACCLHFNPLYNTDWSPQLQSKSLERSVQWMLRYSIWSNSRSSSFGGYLQYKLVWFPQLKFTILERSYCWLLKYTTFYV